ncbi:hypothetical protein CHS0354_033019 [Potamilus streckersoni]|uniref:Carbohydrate sulfotransferase n=1 Tax=Potamilus streckersoni TaxID=2493646 RepID=A0AAE0RX51_9BIVA|nr:hypothetical protein CHS0354_033019 [Potamilus streckersoni]
MILVTSSFRHYLAYSWRIIRLSKIYPVLPYMLLIGVICIGLFGFAGLQLHPGGTWFDKFRNANQSAFALARYLKNICPKATKAKLALAKNAHYCVRHKVMYCPVEKSGSTFWRRVFYLLYGWNTSYVHPFQVPVQEALSQQFESFIQLRLWKRGNVSPESFFMFMFVRNPYTRILSAYVDKLYPHNPVYWKKFGVPAIRTYRQNPSTLNLLCGHDATFEEFLKFVIQRVLSNKYMYEDVHFASISEMCNPCKVSYDYVGKMESFQTDSKFLLKQLGLESSLDAIGESFLNMSVYDAIVDSVYGPYSWRQDLTKYPCITWNQSLRRLWRKLQLRGIISFSQSYPFDGVDPTLISKEEYIQFAWNSHLLSSKEELDAQKENILKEAYGSVKEEDLARFKSAFKSDFHLFGYDDSPAFIVHRVDHSSSYKYLSFMNI